MFRLADRDIGLISLILSLTTNFGQPIFGYVVDRWRLRNIMPFALGLATVFTCTVGFTGSLWLFMLFVMLGGMGIALFHPRGGALAAEASGSRRALGMSIFGAGGAVGYAVASLGAPLLHNLGLAVGLKPLQGFIFALPLGLAAVALLAKFNPQRQSVEQPVFSLRQHLLPHLRPLTPLLAVMILRAGTVAAYGTFIQVLQGKLHHTPLFQGLVLFVFVAGAALGGIIGSHLSDRCGRRCITIITLLLCPPFLYYALYASPAMVLLLLFIGGFTLRGAESVNIAQTQDLLPNGMSTASAISMGFTWGVAGFVPPLVGLLSDHTGSLALALAATLILPVLAAIVAIALPTNPPRHEELS